MNLLGIEVESQSNPLLVDWKQKEDYKGSDIGALIIRVWFSLYYSFLIIRSQAESYW